MGRRIFTFEKEAMEGREPPDGLSLVDLKAFYLISIVYKNFKEGTFTKEQAAAEKKRIFEQYVLEKSEEEFLSRSSLELSERISATSIAYRKERTIENADKMYAAFWRVKENWYEDEAYVKGERTWTK